MSKTVAFAMLAGMIVLSALSVLVFRMQINRMGSPPAELVGKLTFVTQALLTPLALVAMMSFGIAFIFWTLASTKLPLTVAYPLTSLIYPLVLAGSHFLFGEPLGVQRIAGTLIIMAGLVVSNWGS